MMGERRVGQGSLFYGFMSPENARSIASLNCQTFAVISNPVLSAIMPGGCWSPDVMATVYPVEGVKQRALPEMPIDSGQGAA